MARKPQYRTGSVDFRAASNEEPSVSEADETAAVPGEMANPLLDLLGPVVLAPALVALFWGSGDNT